MKETDIGTGEEGFVLGNTETPVQGEEAKNPCSYVNVNAYKVIGRGD